jgi:hypothetical protein
MIKVTNNTNKSSVALKQFRLENVSLEVCGLMVAPGASVDVPEEDWALQARAYGRLMKMGALSVSEAAAPAPVPGPALVDLGKKKKGEPSTGE